MLIYPAQATGIAIATIELLLYSKDVEDEYIHITELGDGGTLVIELTNPIEKRYVSKDGAVSEERPQC